MKPLVNMQEFKDLNVGFALDEGRYTYSFPWRTIKIQKTKPVINSSTNKWYPFRNVF